MKSVVPLEQHTDPTFEKRVAGRLPPHYFLVAILVLLPWALFWNINIQMFRAESGYLLGLVGDFGFLGQHFRYSYNGHFIPIAFAVEVLTSRIFGPTEILWRVRQLVLMSGLTLSMFGLCLAAASTAYTSATLRWSISTLVPVLLVSMPMMSDFVAWPFMSFQVNAMTLASLGLLFLVKFTGSAGSSPRLLWAAGLTCYFSMHWSGIGLAAGAGVSACLFLLCVLAREPESPLRPTRETCRRVFVVTAILVGLHASAMAFLKTPAEITSQVPGPTPGVATVLIRFGELTAGLAHAVLLQIWAPDGFPLPKVEYLRDDAVYGWALTALGLVIGAGIFTGYRRSPSPLRLTQLVLFCFGYTGILTLEGEMIVRLSADPSQVLNFIIGGRYIIILSYFALILIFSLFLSVRLSNGIATTVACGIVAAGAMCGQRVYQQNVLPKAWSFTRLSHARCWNLLKSIETERFRAGLPLIDVSLKPLAVEFDISARRLEAPLRRELRVPDGAVLAWVSEPDLKARQRDYTATLPSLLELDRQLNPETAGDDRWLIGWNPTEVKEADPRAPPNLSTRIAVAGEEERVIWTIPDALVIFKGVRLLANPSFHADLSIHPVIWPDLASDGAVFEMGVIVDGRTQILMRKTIDPVHEASQRRWNRVVVDLRPYRGQSVDLFIRGLPGPRGNTYGDWCLWGEPRIIQ